MSKGSPRVTLRIPLRLLAEVEATIQAVNYRRREEPLDMSSFILTAIREKLRKMERSRAPRRQPPPRENPRPAHNE